MVTIGDMSKDQLLKILGTCMGPVQNNEVYATQCQNVMQELIKNQKRNALWRKVVAILLYIYCISWTVGALLAALLSRMGSLGAVVALLCGVVISVFLWKSRNRAVAKKITNAEQQLGTLQAQMTENIKPIIDMYEMIPSDCNNAYAVEFLYNAIYSGRASNFGEARVLLVADQRYRDEMAQRKYQADLEYKAKMVMAGAVADSGRQVGRGLTDIANSNRDRRYY